MTLKRKIRPDALVEWIFVISILLSGGTMYGVMRPLYDAGIDDFTFRIFSLMSACLLIATYFLTQKTYITKKQFAILFGIATFFSIYLLVTRVKINSCLESLCIPFVLFFILCCIKGAERFFVRFFDIYSNIVVVLAALSLFFYFGGTVLNIIPGSSFEYSNNGWWYPGTNYYFLSFVNDWQTQDMFGRTFIRNVGIFMEAPGFASPLIMSLWWELFGKKSVNRYRVSIYLVTIATTFSAKALVFGAAVVIMYLYSHASDKQRFWKRIRWAIFPFIGIVAFVFILYVLRQKIISSGDSGSWVIRINDVIAAFRTWIDYPFFGAGFYNLEEIYKNYSVVRTSGTPTMGALNILAFGGIYMFVGYAWGFLRYYLKARRTQTAYIINAFLALSIAFLCTSSSQYSYFLILLLALGYAIRGSKFQLFRQPFQKE